MLSMKRTSIPTNKVCGSASSRHRSLRGWKVKSIWLLLDCWQWKPYLLYVDSHRTAARLPHLFLSSTHLHVIWFAADFSCSIISQTLSSTPILSCSTQDNASWLQQDMAAFCFLKSEVHRGQRYEYCLRSRDIQCWSTSPERRDTNSNSASFFQTLEKTSHMTRPQFANHVSCLHTLSSSSSSSIDSAQKKRTSFSLLEKTLFAAKATPHWDQCDSLQRSSSPGRCSFGEVWELRAPPGRHINWWDRRYMKVWYLAGIPKIQFIMG